VVHVVVTREAEQKISDTRGDIASLESTYMERQHQISMEVVENRGYAIADDKIFLDRENAQVVTKR